MWFGVVTVRFVMLDVQLDPMPKWSRKDFCATQLFCGCRSVSSIERACGWCVLCVFINFLSENLGCRPLAHAARAFPKSNGSSCAARVRKPLASHVSLSLATVLEEVEVPQFSNSLEYSPFLHARIVVV